MKIRVYQLAKELGVPSKQLVEELKKLGVDIVSYQSTVDEETADLLRELLKAEPSKAAESGKESKVESTEEETVTAEAGKSEKELAPKRPPVVTVMGHVDHGKTTLLDAIRRTRVAEREVGGITQSIGASVVNYKGQKIVFIDTPGHEAFTEMRARGAMVTDIVVLVVAADEGVMPQTIEALNHAKAAGVAIIVALNKMDRPGANPDRVMNQLAAMGLIPENWGGDTIYVPVSAIKGEGIEDLLEAIILIADLLDLRGDPDAPLKAYVIESRLDKGKGPLATVVVREGTLRVGDFVVVGTTYGKIRAMFDDKGDPISSAGPSMPAEIMGIQDVPEAGTLVQRVDSLEEAERIAKSNLDLQRDKQQKTRKEFSLEEILSSSEEEKPVLNLILKADTAGSLEAVQNALLKLEKGEVDMNIIHAGVGAISDGDVILAEASKALIVGFNVRPVGKTNKLIEEKGIKVLTYRIIYDLVDDMANLLKGLVKPKEVEVVLGHAEVRRTFKVPRVGTVAGCYVTDGKIVRNGRVRVLRNGVIVAETSIGSLKRFKDDVREVVQGFECGVGLENFHDIKEGDILEVYTIQEEVA
ncbi:MAG TPA: translation initiation factor IF-2 [Coprothermobacter proteolyticus]|uniref:translation initiation factor IF-2 n=1 Tax=Coprothermobacter proteolyticus TaxID=35786 RepID=UPI000D303698|nr:translation initiation factor IF-2 [Coprothermobacter proteolyticus]HOA64704.1 translation initiation factor IF-2 [Coprothermobacter proteolyticus]